MTAPEWYRLANLDYTVWCDLSEIVATIRGGIGAKPLLVSNDLSEFPELTQGFYADMAADGHPPLAITHTSGGLIHREYQIWLTPNFSHNTLRGKFAMLHELSHAYLGSQFGHSLPWKNLYVQSLRVYGQQAGVDVRNEVNKTYATYKGC